MDVDVNRMLPVTALLGDNSDDTGIREPQRMMRHSRCRSFPHGTPAKSGLADRRLVGEASESSKK